MKFLDKDAEGSRQTGILNLIALDNSFIGRHTALDIIGFDREHFLQGVSGTVSFQRPHFHFTETLAAELGLTAQRLLRNKAVRAGGTGMDLVLDQVVQLQHRHDADGDRLVKRFTGFTVHQDLFPDDRHRMSGPQADMGSLVTELGLVMGARGLIFGGDPESQAGQDRSFILRQFRRSVRLDIGPVDDGGRIVSVIAEPFAHDGMLQLDFLVQVFHINAAFAEDFGNISAADFIVIHKRSGIQVLFVSPVPGLIAPFLPGGIKHPGAGQFGFDLVFGGAVKDRRDRAETEAQRSPAEMDFQDLTDIHTARNTQRVQDDIDRRTVFKVRHVFHRNDTGNDTLVTMTAGHLVTGGQLAALGDRDADAFVHAGIQIGIIFSCEDLDINDLTAFTVRHTQGIVFDVAGFFTKDRAEQTFFRGQFLFALRGDLTDDDVVRADFGTDADDTLVIQVFDRVITDVRNVAGDLFRPQLGFQRVVFIFFNMHGREFIFHDDTFGDQDRVLKVAAFPGDKSHDDVLAERELSVNGGGRIREDLVLLDLLSLPDGRALVNAGALVGALIFAQLVRMDRAFVRLDDDLFGVDGDHFTVFGSGQHLTGVDGRVLFHTGGNQRNIRVDERHGLCLHVGTHQRAVRIIMFEERDQRGADTDHLLRGNIHVFDVFRGRGREFGIMADRNALLVELHVRLHPGIGLGDAEFIFGISGQVIHFVGNERGDQNFIDIQVLDLFEQRFIHTGTLFGDDVSVLVREVFAQFAADEAFIILVEEVEDAAVRRFDKAVFIDLCVVRQTADQTNVRTFRGFDRADASVVRVVYIADVKTGAFTAQTARTQCGKRTLVAQFGKRVVLVHELGKLRRTEEFTQRGRNRADVDQADRGNMFLIVDRHTFLDHAFHAAQTDAEFVADQFADRLDTAVAEVVNIILFLGAVVDLDHMADKVDDVPLRDVAVLDRNAFDQIELLVQLVAADPFQVIVALVEELFFEEFTRVFKVDRVAGAHLLEELDQGQFADRHAGGRIPDRFLFEGRFNEFAVLVVVDVTEQGEQFLIGPFLDRGFVDAVIDSSQRAQEDRDRHGALAVEFQNDVVILAGLELHPRTAVRDQFRHRLTVTGGMIDLGFKVDARGADQLGNDDTFGTVDDKRTAFRHFREFAQKHILADRARHSGSGQKDGNIKRGGISQVALNALINRLFRFIEPEFQVVFPCLFRIARKIQLHSVVEGLNRGNFIKEFCDTVFLQTPERIELNVNKTGKRIDIRNTRIGLCMLCSSQIDLRKYFLDNFYHKSAHMYDPPNNW